MITIQMKLKDIIEKIMIPESKAFLNELDEFIKNNNSSEDDLEAKKDMELSCLHQEELCLVSLVF